MKNIVFYLMVGMKDQVKNGMMIKRYECNVIILMVIWMDHMMNGIEMDNYISNINV
jgi:hypothetical protein